MAKLGLSGRMATIQNNKVDDYVEMIGNLDIAEEIQLMNDCLMRISVNLYNWIPNIEKVRDFDELCSKELDIKEDQLCLKNLQRISQLIGISSDFKSFSDFLARQIGTAKLVKELT